MKIAHIVAGAGGMYCGMCIRESTLAATLRAAGQDVSLIPLYTPIRTDGEDVSDGRLFFGGINVYLQQKSALFRHTPWAMDRVFDNRRLVRWATSTSAKAAPSFLGDLTVSMLAGEHGRQRKELEKLVRALRDTIQPEVVHLSTMLLLGAVPQIKAALGVPVVVGLSGEDIFLDALPNPQRERCLTLLAERARDADAFIAISDYYAQFAVDHFDIARERIHVVHSGIDLDGFDAADTGAEAGGPFTVGYLARISPEKGLELLVEAFRRLRATAGARPCRLRVAGWLGKHERAYLASVRRNVEAAGLGDVFEYVGELDRPGKIRFLSELSAFCVPTIYPDPRGLCAIEAMAAGVPIVQPQHGVFPELIEATGGGVLVAPNDPDALAAALRQLMDDDPLRRQLGQRGRAGVADRFSAPAMAQATLDVYERYCAGGSSSKVV